VSSHSGVAATFVAPAVSREILLEGVTLEDGGFPLERGAEVVGRAEATPLQLGVPQDAWRSVRVGVAVALAGYRTLQYDFRLDEPVAPRVMERDLE